MTRQRFEIAAGVALLTALGLALFSPADVIQGDLARIMYVHVPSAWLAYLAFGITLIGSVGYLVTRNLTWDLTAAASAEIGVFFTGLAIALGMLWAKPVWGVYWTWDARLTLTAIMFFVYVGYLALRRSFREPLLRARRSAILGILGAIQIPLVHFSVVWWRGLHQPPTVLRGDPQIDGPLLVALLAGFVAFTVVYAALLRRRVELARLDLEIQHAEEHLMTSVAGDAIAAPVLTPDRGDRDV